MDFAHKRISFLIPFANITSSIEDTLKSIYSIHGLRDFEIILLNMTDQVISPRERLVIKKHKKLKRAHARNLTAELSTGDILVFLDDNTILAKDFYFKLLHSERLDSDYDALQGTIYLSPVKENLCFISVYFEYKNATKGSFNVSTTGIIDTAFFIIPKTTFNNLGGFSLWLNRYEDREFARRLTKNYKLGKLENTHAIKRIEPLSYSNLLCRRIQENYYQMKCNLHHKGTWPVISSEFDLIFKSYLSKDRFKYIKTKEGFNLYLINGSMFFFWIIVFPFALLLSKSLLLFSNTNNTTQT